ncbi:ATP-binding protein [Ancylobacter lacus]|uniref:ATP-binding protein n=1 Tax=Ancylobacter lacus TaxID=2579970 RepID=UPI001BCDB272|nr:ATP-binding protein [Ancylobacter lacus]MBS7538871.1 HAMP domain-containing protein [Ancylobacter lacus]
MNGRTLDGRTPNGQALRPDADGLPAGAGVARRLWRARSLRFQVLAVFLAINALAAIGAAALVIANARRATNVEMAASLAIAARFVESTVQRISAREGASASLEQLPFHIGGLRHVRIRIETAGGRSLDVAPNADSRAEGDDEAADPARDSAAAQVPGWFVRLVDIPPMVREIPIHEGVTWLGRVIISGESADEIAEVWEDMSDLAVLAGTVSLVILAALYLALGRLFAPLRDLAAGFGALEAGDYRHRLPPPRVREFGALTRRFNALAVTLQAARDDTARLNRRLVTAQDDERRRVAADLHDELGPCLFGVRANLDSIARLAADAGAGLRERLRDRAGDASAIVDRMQTLNRRLLRSLRPMALGHVPLCDLIADLVADFERSAPEHRFTLEAGDRSRIHEEGVGLTAYRCAQEAITNAVRHAGASHVRVRLEEFAGAEGPWLRLSVEDDGVGFRPDSAAGYGLIGIEERVAALGGRWRIAAGTPGTRVEFEIPAEAGGFDTATREPTT